MPRHPPIALKTLDRSHCQCPSSDRWNWHKKTSFSRSVRGQRLGKPIMCGGLSVLPRRTVSIDAQPITEGYGPSKAELRTRNPNKSSLHDFKQNRRRAIARRKPCLRMTWPSSHTLWWSRTGSNRRPPACKAGALPAELRPLISSERKWWAWEDLNLRPHAYQARALTN